ncbi:MAG: HNH endonuclease [Proteobacteria bacterium]|nr:HNH endonuclease [Pseudomonadota bacterium]
MALSPSRRCLREPVAEIFQAANHLSQAAEAHLAGHTSLAISLIKKADCPAIAAWTESLWGKTTPYNIRTAVPHLPPLLARGQRQPLRMPSTALQQQLLARDGYHCRYCGIPLIRKEVRVALQHAYPQAVRWGSTNASQHTALQAMWLTYEHVVPHARGGTNEVKNLIVSCWPCNGAKAQYMLEEFGLADPRLTPPCPSTWDGLERILPPAKKGPAGPRVTQHAQRVT